MADMITLEVEVPRRVDSYADAEQAMHAVAKALNRYLINNSKTGGEIYQHAVQPNAQLVAIMPKVASCLISDSNIAELKKYFPQENWDRVIPMRALLNAFHGMPDEAREALHAQICGTRGYDPNGPKYEVE